MLLPKILLLFMLLLSAGSAFADNDELKVIDLKHRRAEEVLPVVKQMMGDRGVATVLDNHLILRGSGRDLAVVEKLVDQLDVKRAMLRVVVRHEQAAGGSRSSTGFSGRVDRPHRTLAAKPAAVVSGRYSRTLGNMNQSVEQYLQVLDGEQAFIEVGRRIPFVRFRSYVTGRQQGFSEAVDLQNVTTGFFVRPQLLGETVMMEIMPHFASENSERDGVIDFATLTSRVTMPLNEWFDIAGHLEQGSDVGRAILSIRAGDNASARRFWIKVTR